jgi:redox-sensitive bicupin YhaK (pirin superfamily)
MNDSARNTTTLPSRPVRQLVRGHAAADGAGVRLTRVIGGPQLPLLDHIRSDDPREYIGGFPSHPHRGFETVTYLLAGRVRHEDNAGHAGVIEPSGVQWMTAGRGVVHSEMPEQKNGLLAGFQLWVNLPAAHKLMPPRYQEFDRRQLPEETRRDGARVRVVAGATARGTAGPVRELVTPALLLDVSLEAGGRLEEPLPGEWNAFVYVIEGSVAIAGTAVAAGSLAVLGEGGRAALEAAAASRLLLVAGRPIGEPVARMGPFVMNTEAELRQAFRDFQAGNF